MQVRLEDLIEQPNAVSGDSICSENCALGEALDAADKPLGTAHSNRATGHQVQLRYGEYCNRYHVAFLL